MVLFKLVFSIRDIRHFMFLEVVIVGSSAESFLNLGLEYGCFKCGVVIYQQITQIKTFNFYFFFIEKKIISQKILYPVLFKPAMVPGIKSGHPLTQVNLF